MCRWPQGPVYVQMATRASDVLMATRANRFADGYKGQLMRKWPQGLVDVLQSSSGYVQSGQFPSFLRPISVQHESCDSSVDALLTC